MLLKYVFVSPAACNVKRGKLFASQDIERNDGNEGRNCTGE